MSKCYHHNVSQSHMKFGSEPIHQKKVISTFIHLVFRGVLLCYPFRVVELKRYIFIPINDRKMGLANIISSFFYLSYVFIPSLLSKSNKNNTSKYLDNRNVPKWPKKRFIFMNVSIYII